MKLYLTQHGDSELAEKDPKRPLSALGEADIKHLTHFISPLNLHVQRAFHSGKLRAEQTATILSQGFKSRDSFSARADLEPMAPISTMLNDLLNWQEDSLLVSHQPFLGKLLSQLLIGDENKNLVNFTPGSMVCLQQNENKEWALLWMLSPDFFRG